MEIKSVKKISRTIRSTLSHIERAQKALSSPPLSESAPTSPLSYAGKKLHYEGKDVGELIRSLSKENPQMLSQIANELERFKEDSPKRKKRKSFFSRQAVWEYTDDDLGNILALCDAYITRIGEILTQRYDQTKDGLSVTFDEGGQLILNGVNISALVEKCQNDPNEKLLIYLKGIQNRLDHVLQNKMNSRNYDRIQEVVTKLNLAITHILKNH